MAQVYNTRGEPVALPCRGGHCRNRAYDDGMHERGVVYSPVIEIRSSKV